ncbi:uncharacterized protein LOC120077100 [Benincasa hispida]|uniref:uncharacterized protein LOC120077100 n=1 Tax=Benincasa hispida TaxID=102211 RepID=UPI0019020349|nr:uncharacterized protein LOC120077100 [Benincasa hispida]
MEAISGSSSSSSISWGFVFCDDFEYEFVEDIERLSNWELLDAFDADSEMDGNGSEEQGENCSVDDRVYEDLREMIVPISLVEDRIDGSLEDIFFLQNQAEDTFAYGYNDSAEEEEEEEIDGDDDEFDLDDELVPWSVSDKLGRQRMRKLGKRGFTKMYNSKRSPFLFTKPGCVRGKHGLGLKHSY